MIGIKNSFFLIIFSALTACAFTSCAQVIDQKEVYSKADSLRGNLSSLFRTSYDINFYHLDVKINPEQKYISGNNLFRFTAKNDFKTLQFDLFDNLKIDKIIYHGKEIGYKREFNAVFVEFPKEILKGQVDSFKVYYSGNPIVAKNAPWDGGFVFSKHKDKDWLATACQGLGASSWWPNKDQQEDEVDSALISISVPNEIMDVSNGRLIRKTDLKNGYTRYDWKVSNPINNYGIAVNATNYAHFSDTYKGLNGDLSLDYYVLPENLKKAKSQFIRDVLKMLAAFEYWFGAYPFYKDGYKLVETPYLGMEHQSAIAYGNGFQNGYLGRDLSDTGWGLKWDFIIVHESGHEWFGNNITSKDIADMWIHESFTNYSESLFTEYWYGKKAGAEYVIGLRKNILNDQPIIGPYGVNKEGSGDMYYKGANLLHMVRTIINDDEKWRSILTGLNKDFGKKTTTTNEVVNYINLKSGIDFTAVFKQYLNFKSIPVLEFRKQGGIIECKWQTNVPAFAMPVKLIGKEEHWIYPTTQWQSIKTQTDIKNLKVSDDFYIKISFI